jgi:DNA replication protein DnaC
MLSSTFLDELGYVPASKVGAELLFDVISTAYERTSIIVTTNRLCGAPHNKFNAEQIVMRSPFSRDPANESRLGFGTPHKGARF